MGAFKIGLLSCFYRWWNWDIAWRTCLSTLNISLGELGSKQKYLTSRRVLPDGWVHSVICSQPLTAFPAVLPCSWSVLSHPVRLCLAMWPSLANGTWGVLMHSINMRSSFKDTRVLWFCLSRAPFLCHEKTWNKPCWVSPTNTAPSPWVPKKKTHGAKPTQNWPTVSKQPTGNVNKKWMFVL